jgi:hypothetical protein
MIDIELVNFVFDEKLAKHLPMQSDATACRSDRSVSAAGVVGEGPTATASAPAAKQQQGGDRW